jgi:hypothetical protein
VLELDQTDPGKAATVAPIDGWVNPFRRQQLLEKQQRQAAKNQKKKDKKRVVSQKSSGSFRPGSGLEGESASAVSQESLALIPTSPVPAFSVKGRKQILPPQKEVKAQEVPKPEVLERQVDETGTNNYKNMVVGAESWDNPSKADFLSRQELAPQVGAQTLIENKASSATTTETLKGEQVGIRSRMYSNFDSPVRTRSNTELSLATDQKTVPPNTPSQVAQRGESSISQGADPVQLERSLSSIGLAPLANRANSKLRVEPGKMCPALNGLNDDKETASSKTVQFQNGLDEVDAVELLGGIGGSLSSLKLLESMSASSTEPAPSISEVVMEDKDQETKKRKKNKKKNRKKRKGEGAGETVDEIGQPDLFRGLPQKTIITTPESSTASANHFTIAIAPPLSQPPGNKYGVGEVTNVWEGVHNRAIATTAVPTATYNVFPDGSMAPINGTPDAILAHLAGTNPTLSSSTISGYMTAVTPSIDPEATQNSSAKSILKKEDVGPVSE